jgi:hypothetical protein
VTHPFHPLLGREIQVVSQKRIFGNDWLFFIDDEEQQSSVLVAWTSLSVPAPLWALSAGRAYLRADDLLRLADLIAGVES